MDIITTGPNRGFEDIKKIDENGIEYWTARDLFPLLGYAAWQSFEEVIERAEKTALHSGQTVEDHFRRLTKMVDIGSGGKRAINENKKLFKTAKQAGVSHFGLFNDAGYKGLYGTSLSEVERKKGIKKGELLDRAGSTKLAANLFRITQTEEKLRKDKVKEEMHARQTHNMVGGKVRQTIKDIGGVLPENLKSERHLKEVKRELKLLEKQTGKINASSGKSKRLK